MRRPLFNIGTCSRNPACVARTKLMSGVRSRNTNLCPRALGPQVPGLFRLTGGP
jgi:hypothetical protein